MVAGNSWHSLDGKCITPFPASIIIWLSPCGFSCIFLFDSVNFCLFSSFKGSNLIRMGSFLFQYVPFLRFLYLQWPYFHITLYLEVLGIGNWVSLSGGMQFNQEWNAIENVLICGGANFLVCFFPVLFDGFFFLHISFLVNFHIQFNSQNTLVVFL
jgi:hypothetical protein